MRLRTIHDELVAGLAALRVVSTKSVALVTGVGGLAISGLRSVRSGLRRLQKLPLGPKVAADLRALLDDALMLEGEDPLHAQAAAWERFGPRLAALAEHLTTVASALAASVSLEGEQQFSVRLPPVEGRDGIEGVRDDLSRISKALDLPLHWLLKTTVKVVGFDRGSAWLEVLAHSKEAAILIGALVGAWKTVVETRTSQRLQLEQLQKAKLENRVIEMQGDVFAAFLRSIVREKAEEIVVTVVPEAKDDPDRSRVRVIEESIWEGAKFLQDGGAVELFKLPASERPSAPPDRPLVEASHDTLRLGPGEIQPPPGDVPVS